MSPLCWGGGPAGGNHRGRRGQRGRRGRLCLAQAERKLRWRDNREERQQRDESVLILSL